MNPILSVALCTRNPRPDFLAVMLSGLAQQTLPVDRWSLLVIDNGSEPPLATRMDLSWHPHATVVRETEPGLTRARLAAIRNNTAPLLVFVDDDNELSSDYLEQTAAIGAAWPQLGTWGGQLLPVFERPPAEWTREYWNWLAIRPLQEDRWSNVMHEAAAHPYGAGMCVRRQVAEAYAAEIAAHPLRRQLDRLGNRLWGGGDADLAFTSCRLGFGNGVFRNLTLKHHMPASRLEEDYLLLLVEDMTCSHHLLKHVWGVPPSSPSRSERLFRWYRNLHIDPRSRRFAQARIRGLRQAVGLIAGLSCREAAA